MQATMEACPECGTLRQDARYCVSCRYDFDSLTHQFRGTQWSQASAEVEVAMAMAPPPERTFRHALGRIVLFYFGLAIVAGASLWSIRNGIVPDDQVPYEVGWLLFVVIPLTAGLASQIIPGRHARGPFKSWLIGFVAWVGGLALLTVAGWDYGSMGYPSGAIEQALVAITGASIFRLSLFVTS